MTLAETPDVAVFMASDEASGMTGTTVNLSMGSLDDERLIESVERGRHVKRCGSAGAATVAFRAVDASPTERACVIATTMEMDKHATGRFR